MGRQRATAGLTEVARGAGARVPGVLGGAYAAQRATGRREGLHRALRERRRLPGHALIELEVGLRLLEEVPVRHRLGCLVPGGRARSGVDAAAHRDG